MLEPGFRSFPADKTSALPDHCLGAVRNRGAQPLSREVEVKLAASAAELEKLERLLQAMPTARFEAQSELVSTYYDTPTLALRREGLTLRVRKQGRKFLQTVKADGPASIDWLERWEWEKPIASDQPDLDSLKDGTRLPDTIHKEEVRPVFATKVTRKAFEVRPTPSTPIEVAIDRGEIRTADGGAIEPVSELELELKDGDPVALYDLALQFLNVAEIRLETRSKAERGYRLLGSSTDRPQAVRAGTVALDRHMTVEAALQRFGLRCLGHLLRNEPIALADEPEAIHQMRVAVRRIRSALSALKKMLPAEHHRWISEELKWLARSLAAARNWEVFVVDLLRTVNDALPSRRELEHLARTAERCSRTAFDDAKQAILSKRYTGMMLRLLRWFTARDWRDQPISESASLLLAPIANVAPGLIERRHRKARRRCKRFEQLNSADRHKLRIALKKLRYTIEFLGSLFEKHDVQAFVNRLKSLQDQLGHANDVRVAYDLLDQMQETSGYCARAVDRAGGIVMGWHERDLAHREPILRKHVKRFKRSEPFW
jgi:triphosphatase